MYTLLALEQDLLKGLRYYIQHSGQHFLQMALHPHSLFWDVELDRVILCARCSLVCLCNPWQCQSEMI